MGISMSTSMSMSMSASKIVVTRLSQQRAAKSYSTVVAALVGAMLQLDIGYDVRYIVANL